MHLFNYINHAFEIKSIKMLIAKRLRQMFFTIYKLVLISCKLTLNNQILMSNYSIK